MITGLYSSASGMMTQMMKQDVETENLVRANHPGYKRRFVVSQTFPKTFKNYVIDEDGTNRMLNPERNGVINSKIVDQFDEGKMKYTGHELDVAIQGDGFFVIQTPDGGTAYTRNGAFTLNDQGQLVTLAGNPVMGEGGPISFPISSSAEIKIDENGGILVGEEVLDNLRIVDFPKPYQLTKSGVAIYTAPNAVEGAAVNARVGQGYLEMPNFNIVEGMTNLIQIQRTYDMNATMVRSADDSLKEVIQKVGRV